MYNYHLLLLLGAILRILQTQIVDQSKAVPNQWTQCRHKSTCMILHVWCYVVWDFVFQTYFDLYK